MQRIETTTLANGCNLFNSMRHYSILVFIGESDVTETFGGPWSGAEGLYEAMNAVAAAVPKAED